MYWNVFLPKEELRKSTKVIVFSGVENDYDETIKLEIVNHIVAGMVYMYVPKSGTQIYFNREQINNICNLIKLFSMGIIKEANYKVNDGVDTVEIIFEDGDIYIKSFHKVKVKRSEWMTLRFSLEELRNFCDSGKDMEDTSLQYWEV